MALVVVNAGQLDELARLIASWADTLRIGTYSNDWTPQRGDDISKVVPSAYSGYSGLHQLLGWTTPVLLNGRAATTATPRLWVRGAGNVSEWVVGYYVINPAGALLWAERRPGRAWAMTDPGNQVTITPAFSCGSWF